MTRLRFLVVPKGHAAVDEELAFHLEQQTEANVASGMTPAEARRQAVIAFGGVERAREECREARPGFWMETMVQDVRYSVRGFRRNPVFTLTIVVTLMLGIGTTAAVFSVVDRILFRSLPYGHAERLVSVGLAAPVEPQEFMLGGSYYEWRDHQRPFEALTSETGVNPCDLTEERPMRLSCAGVEANFLPTLGVSPVLGRNFTAEEDRPNAPKVALISYQLWEGRFGRDSGILNRLVNVDDHTVRVIGVLPKDFEMPRLQGVDVMMPEGLDAAVQRKADPGQPMWAFARLKPGVNIEQAKEQLQPVFDYSLRLAPAPFRKEVHLQVRSLRDRQMRDVWMVAWILSGLVVGVLLIACANVTSLLMARGAGRERELAVRSALGASRGRLVRQGLTESLMLSLAGAVAGCALAGLLLRVFLAIAPEGIPLLSKARIDGRIIAFTFALSSLCAVLAGLVPALQRPRAEALAGRTAVSSSHAVLRQWLVVAQIAASMILLTGGALLFRSFLKLQHQRLGMQTESVAAVSLSLGQKTYGTPERQMAFFQELQRMLRYGPGVRALAVSDTLPPGGYHRDQIYASIGIEGRQRPASGTGGLVAWRSVTPDYFSALDIPIVGGEGFTEEEQGSSDHFVILSRRLARRMFPGQNSVGHRLRLTGWTPDNPWYTVVGVAEDVKNGGLAGEDEPEYYRLRRNRPEDWTRASTIIIKITLPPETVKGWVRAQVAALDPTVPADVETLSERVSRMADRPRFESLLVGFFAATGLLLAVVGLYGVISFLVTQRTQEIGVRMALGASRGDILRLVMGRSLRLIAGGTIAGLVAALAASRVLSSLLFSVGPRDPLTFGLVVVVLVLVGLAASLIPARLATRVDPAVALRSE
ncbi:MAG TPA: ABC transporter permease [Edaphobacter sp.]